MSSTNRRRKKPLPPQSRTSKGTILSHQNLENGARYSPELSEEDKSRKTDSGSDDKHSGYSSGNQNLLNGQNFSYSNFHSFGGGNSPQQQSENYPPKLQHAHSHSSQQTLSQHQNKTSPGQQAVFPLFEQRSEWVQHNYPAWPHSNKSNHGKTANNAWTGSDMNSQKSASSKQSSIAAASL